MADASLLYPEEALCCTGSSPKRIADFTAGRLCARRALHDLGIDAFPIGVNPDRTPCWPPGIVGSISHTTGYACAVAADQRTLPGIGIDVEVVGRVTEDIERLVFVRDELLFLSTLTEAQRKRATTIVFSAKEAFYKCQYPITRRWLDFNDASLDLITTDMLSGSFVVRAAGTLEPDACFPQLRGRFRIEGEHALTGIAQREV